MGDLVSLRLCVAVVVLAFGFATGAAVAEASFSAHGSVEQVYVTGTDPGARMTLLDPAGHKVATRRATAEGGVLFRDVKPAGGYRVRPAAGGAASPSLRVLTKRSAPPSTAVFDQKI